MYSTCSCTFFSFWAKYWRYLEFHLVFDVYQKGVETPELEKGAVKAIQDLYDVVQHDVLAINMRSVNLLLYGSSCTFFLLLPWMHEFLHICREHYETWNILSKARTEGRLFTNLKWPQDAELVCLGSCLLFSFQFSLRKCLFP